MIRSVVFSITTLVASATQANDSIQVSPLKKSEEVTGCGFTCSLAGKDESNPDEIFGSDMTLDHKGNIYGFIRVNGRLEKVKRGQAKETPKRNGPYKIGDHFTESWSNQSVSIQFECRLTGKNEEGEAFVGKMIVRVGRNSRTFKIDGGRGC